MRNFERALFPRVHNCQIFTMADSFGVQDSGIMAGNCDAKISDEL
jgi:hypothetical protein